MPDMYNFAGFLDIMQYAPLLLRGLETTLWLSLAVMITGLVLGFQLALIRYYGLPVFAWLVGVYVYLVRSVPLIMLIALVHFALLPLLNIQASVFIAAFVGLSLSTTAYVSEIIRGGLNAIRDEEKDAAVSLGLSFIQRLVHITIPLVLSRMMPALVNQFVTLIKDTSLASIIGVIELTRSAEIVYERTLHDVELLGLVALIYFLLCYGLSKLSHRLVAQENSPTVLAR